MSRRKRVTSDFGERLIAARKAKGLTQVQLAQAIESTQRAISSYETGVSYPAPPVLAEIARALGVTADELLGLRSRANRTSRLPEDPDVRRMWRKFQQVLALPEKDQRAVTRLVSSLVAGVETRTHAHD